MSENENEVLYTVWAEREPGPRFCKVSQAVPKDSAIRILRLQWTHGIKARLDPPLGRAVSDESSVEVLGTA